MQVTLQFFDLAVCIISSHLHDSSLKFLVLICFDTDSTLR